MEQTSAPCSILAAATTAAATAGIFAIGRVGNVAATRERPVMHVAIALNAECIAIASILDHRARVAANSQWFIGKETMVIIQINELIHAWNGSLICSNLVVLLT